MKKYMSREFFAFFLKNTISWMNALAIAFGIVFLMCIAFVALVAPTVTAFYTGNAWWMSLYLCELAALALIESVKKYGRA